MRRVWISRWLPYLCAILAALAVLAATWIVDRAEHERFTGARHAAVLSQASAMRAQIEEALNGRLYLVNGLAAYAAANPDLDEAQFEAFARGLLGERSGIRELALARGTTVTHVHPRSTNEAVIGVDLLDLPAQRQAVQEAIDRRAFVVAGPLELVQGGTAFVGRLPIFLSDSTDSNAVERFWGLALIVIEQTPLFAEAGLLDPSSGVEWAVRGRDGRGSAGDVFLGDASLFEGPGPVLNVSLPSGSWQLAAAPAGGWAFTSPAAGTIRIGGGLIALLSAMLTFVLVRSPTRLRAAVDQATERTRELRALLHISHDVASTLELKPLLEVTLAELKSLVEYTGAAILTLDGDELVIAGDLGPVVEGDLPYLRWPIAALGPVWDRLARSEPIIIPDVRGDEPIARRFRELNGPWLDEVLASVRSCLWVPLVVKDQVIGLMSITHGEPDHYTDRDAELALAVARQAAIAIENARLYEAARGKAALEERQRLARELHDSVSQALYGIALGARTARTLLDRDPSQVDKPLDYVLSLAEAGLAEMRSLIFELRPESLEAEGLVAALDKQAAFIRARHGLTVNLALGDEPDLSLDAKEALYRIAQEALHNILKHAQARSVSLSLSSTSAEIVLEIGDDGVGFDTAQGFPGHLGLRSMRERIERLRGTIELRSGPGEGSRIRARLPR